MHRRSFVLSAICRHENPLGLPRRIPNSPPQIPRKGGPPQRRPIPHVTKVLVVASGKGGVGKSTVAVNLAFALAMHHNGRRRVGILDLDLFGPSVPKLMGLGSEPEPRLTDAGAIIPLWNHGLPCMSMGFLLPRAPGQETSIDTPVVWRGLMVQKAVQQLLFDVDWRDSDGGGRGLDVLVVDMPPGTGDVPLTLGQLVEVDGALIVSTPQDVALSDVRKGVAMFSKVSIPILGLLLNQSYYVCPSCSNAHALYGPPDAFRAVAQRLAMPVLAELPLSPLVSADGDAGAPHLLLGTHKAAGESSADREWAEGMRMLAAKVWEALEPSEKGGCEDRKVPAL